MNRNKRTTHEHISFFNPWTETSTLHMNISRSLIHEPKQWRYTWIYHMKISRFLIHTSATHVILVVLLAMRRNKRTTHENISFFNPWTETRTPHMTIPRSLIHEPKQACYIWNIRGELSQRHETLHRDSISRSLNHWSWTIFSQVPLIEFPIATELPEYLAE